MEKLEAHVAHLEKTLDELSAVVARQDQEIATLTRRVTALMAREAEREAAEGATAPVADRPPPHW